MIALTITNAITFLAFLWVCSMYRKDLQRMNDHFASQVNVAPVFEEKPASKVTYINEHREVELEDREPTKVRYQDEA